MKRILILLFMLAVGLTLPQPATATDYMLLELLIKNHKVQSDRLKTRISMNGAATATQMLKEDRSEELKLKIDTLSNRFSGSLMDLTLALDAAGILSQVITVGAATERAVDKALDMSVEHPEVLVKAYYLQQRAREKIEDIYAIVKQIVTNGLKASLATKEQRKQFVWSIRSKLDWIEYNMNQYYYYCSVRSHVPRKYTPGAIDQVILTDGQAEKVAFDKAIVQLNGLNLW